MKLFSKPRFGGLSARLLSWMMVLALFGLLVGSARATDNESGYRLDAGDTVYFDILDDEEPPVQLTVSAEGYIQLPLAGAFKVSGLTIEDARTKIDMQFVERELLIKPKIALSVATFRPIFVLGDVKTPGSVLFHPFITAEQAVGLAGGPLTAFTSAEDRIMTRTRLQNDINVNSVELAKEALLAARYAAQIAGRTTIELDDIPAAARPFIDRNTFDRLRLGVERALQSEAAALAADIVLIDGSISEAQNQMVLFEELVTNQKKSIKFSEDGLKRTEDLLKKGLRTAADLDTFQRQLMSDESRLLSTLAQISQARNTISGLKRERAQLANNRMTEALRSHQEHSAAIDKFIATRKGVEEQLLLVANLSLEELQQTKTTVVDYVVRRRELNGMAEMNINGQTQLNPGDVLIVAMKRVGQSRDTASISTPGAVPAKTP